MRIPSTNPQAIACVRGGMGAPRLKGTVRFYAIPGGTLVTAEVSGLPENDTGFFAVHIHEGSGCGGTDFSDTGGHYNPDAREHPVTRETCRRCSAWVVGRFSRWRRADSRPARLVGRTVVIHGSADDFHTQPAGNAGKKIACGVIRRV